MSELTRKIFLMSGEPSGDKLGALLAEALLKFDPKLQLRGVGGNQMQQAGVHLIQRSEALAIVGVIEIVRHLKLLKQTLQKVVNELNQKKPDLVILIDYPGFNLRLAKKAKKLGIPVMYYVSPQIWAWHYSRIKKIKQNVDLMAVLFPFEKKLYEKENVPVEFVGHPLMENVKPNLSREKAYQKFKLDPQQPIIALLPGSRLQEIHKLLPDMLAAAKRLKKRYRTMQFVLPIAASLPQDCLNGFALSGIQVIGNDLYNVLQLADAAISASGTVTLEVALLHVPQVIIYKVNPLTYLIGKRVTHLKHFGLCNIVAQETTATELLQNQVNPQRLFDEIDKMLQQKAYRQSLIQKMHALQDKLQCGQAADKAATAALSLLRAPH